MEQPVLEPRVILPKVMLPEPFLFPMTKSNYELIETARKIHDNPMDCVINGMEIIGVLPSDLADAFRIVVKNGISDKDTTRLFNYICKIEQGVDIDFNIIHTFKERGVTFLDNYIKLMPVNTAIFLWKQYIDVDSQGLSIIDENGYPKINAHIFIIVKDDSEGILNIDLQMPERTCYLNDQECFDKVLNNDNIITLGILTTDKLFEEDITDQYKTLQYLKDIILTQDQLDRFMENIKEDSDISMDIED